MILTKSDMQEILSNYNLGDFKKFGEVAKNDVISLCQAIYTTKKKVFMKLTHVRANKVIQSLNVARALWEKGYPVYEIFLTKNKKTFAIHKKRPVVLMEFANIPKIKDWPILSVEQMKDYAKQLARFHILTKKMKLEPTYAGSHRNMKGLINTFYKEKLPTFAKQTLKSMKEEMPGTICKNGEYKSGYFSEYSPGHDYFKKNKVSYVIDWEIGRDHAYYDIGGALVTCFSKKGLSYKKLRTFIKSYNKARPLSKWEKDHLYEALKFGAFKYSTWNLVSLETGDIKKPNKITTSDLGTAIYMINLTKEEFNKKLK
ncbi:hypothetical protein DRJ16_03510 [Candidatus Woesearchaeota archaeon]|nr:MAG: hypothetical protein DRJ16_03510 [Candidatus Woesearchaeota archaeon]